MDNAILTYLKCQYIDKQKISSENQSVHVMTSPSQTDIIKMYTNIGRKIKIYFYNNNSISFSSLIDILLYIIFAYFVTLLTFQLHLNITFNHLNAYLDTKHINL